MEGDDQHVNNGNMEDLRVRLDKKCGKEPMKDGSSALNEDSKNVTTYEQEGMIVQCGSPCGVNSYLAEDKDGGLELFAWEQEAYVPDNAGIGVESGISLGSTSTSGVFIDPPIPDTLKLNAWKSKNAITLRSISKSKDYMANANTVVATDSLQMMDINGAIDAPKGTNQFLNDVDDSLKDQPHVFVIRKKLMTRNGTDHDQYVILDVLLENDDTLDEGIADLAHESASKGKVTVSSMQLIDEDDWATDVRVHIEEPSKLSKVNPTHVSSTKTKGKSLARLRENSISQSIENDSVHLIDEAPVEIPRKSSKVNYTRKLSKVNSASVSSSKTKGKSIACRRENSAYQSIDDDSFTLIGGAAPTEIPLKTYKVNSARKLSKVNSAPVSSNKAKDDISGSVEIVTKSCKTKFVDDDAEDYPRRSSRKVKRRLFYGDESGEDDQPIINCIKRKRD
ncbi:hypothetical protein BUALT_Bualt12G0020700 [Buddleja alternifolia]|uniref:Uncharacterized protein n=1 Tax=Buddleja alternifolia TaxID=168488 RepID=A0AAV6WYE6_9LAMI|nr:hypothetical protein BUALT_Bualt12G0020700 [Buddleja alternifolia]